MSNDNKTLADAQPGGRVRLGDQAELDRLEFQAWARSIGACVAADEHGNYVDSHLNSAKLGWNAALSAQPSQVAYHGDVDLKWLSGSIGEVAHRLSTYMPTGLAEWADRARDCRIAAQVLSELSAQPSPGGQDALADAARRVISDVDSGDYGGTISMATYDALVAALAARQPVGEPVGEPVAVIENGAFGGGGLLWIGPMPPIGTKLYAAPPAQAVDLGQFRALAEFGEEFAFSAEKQPQSRVIYAQARRLRALIDSQALGNG